MNQMYQHYKGGLYVTVCMSKHSETLEDLVIYQKYDKALKPEFWARPLIEWNRPLENTGKKRFELIYYKPINGYERDY